MKKVICNDGCNQEFILISPGIEIVKNDIENVGFNCPHCDKRYTLFYTNGHIKQLQDDQRKLLAKSDPTKLTQGQLKGILNRIEAKKREINEAMKKLKNEIEAG